MKQINETTFVSDNGLITFIHGDCMEFMENCRGNEFDLAVVDPPYGIGSRLSDGGGKLKNTPMAALYREKEWDVLPQSKYWEDMFRVSKNQAVFGANYFLEYLPNTRGFVCWDKKQDMPTLSACELVWTSFDKPAKIMRKSSTDLERFHPTQKPIYVYKWIFQYCKVKPTDHILDTHGGSMSSAIAAHMEGLKMTIIELDKEYFDKAIQRFSIYEQQQTINFE